MIVKRRMAYIIPVAVVIAVIMLFIVFSKKPVCKSLNIEFDTGDTTGYTLSEDDITAIVFKEYKNLIGLQFNKIDLNRLESKLEAHPSVENAEVYKRIPGELGIRIQFRQPIVRVIPEKGTQFYIDRYGYMMPLSDQGPCRVIPANGAIVYNYKGEKMTVDGSKDIPVQIKEIYEISKQIFNDPFLNVQIEQIFLRNNKEYELVPKVGDHMILLGDINRIDKKLKYLKHFYLNVMQTEGWRSFSLINLKFDNQIVCTKQIENINN